MMTRTRAIKKRRALHESGRGYFVGFFRAVKTRLKPTQQGLPPSPQSVYKFLTDTRPSRALALNIFENCPELLAHPSTKRSVKLLYTDYMKMNGELPAQYGKQSAGDCYGNDL